MERSCGRRGNKNFVDVRKDGVSLEIICWVSDAKDRSEVVLAVCKCKEGKAGGEDLLVDKGCMEVKEVLWEEDAVLQCEFQDEKTNMEENELV